MPHQFIHSSLYKVLVTPSLLLLIFSFCTSVLILFYFILFINLCVNNIFRANGNKHIELDTSCIRRRPSARKPTTNKWRRRTQPFFMLVFLLMFLIIVVFLITNDKSLLLSITYGFYFKSHGC